MLFYTKKLLFIIAGSFVLVFVSLYLYNKVKIYLIHRDVKLYTAPEAKKFLAQASQELAEGKNDWVICTEQGLKLLDINNPKTVAKYIVYYKKGGVLCKKWWKWDGNKCNYLNSLRGADRNTHNLELRVALCEFANTTNW